MHASSVHLLILILLASVIVIVPIFHFFRINPIIGYMLAGVMLGQHGFGFVKSPEDTMALGELGVVFLLFAIGLELTFDRIKQMGRRALLLGAAQIAVCGLFFAGAAIVYGTSIKAAVIIGSSLALSSTALCLRLLTDRKEHTSSFGQVAISILLIQDLAVVPMMTLAPLLQSPEVSILKALGIAFVKGIFVVTAIVIFGRFVLKYIFQVVSKTKNAELFTATTLFVLLGSAYATEQAGLSMALGGFLAGLLLAETEYHHQVEADMHPFSGILVGLFFATVGMNISPAIIILNLPVVFTILIGIIALKTIAITLLCWGFRLPFNQSLRVGLLLSQGGEFAFILLNLTVLEQVIDLETSQLLFGAIALSMVSTPILDAFATRWIHRLLPSELRFLAFPEPEELNNHAIVVGFGRVGQLVVRMLETQNVPYIAVDIDERSVTNGRKQGKPIFYGDATHLGILRSMGAERAKVIIITADDQSVAIGIAKKLKQHFGDIAIVARAHDEQHLQQLKLNGVNDTALETMELGLQLCSFALEKIGMSESEVLDTIERYRNDQYALLRE